MVIGESTPQGPLRIALLTYRGNPHSGGQGVYARELSRSLLELGHHLTVFSGPPYPDLDPRVDLVRVPSLDLYRPSRPFRASRPFRDWIDVIEFGLMCLAGYPEPLTFSLRAWRSLAARAGDFDIVHDNQCLGYGLLGLDRTLPVVATIHHPITVDLELELSATDDPARRRRLRRWYSFIRMQRRVASRLRRVMTVSSASREGIMADLGVKPNRISVVPNGVDGSVFRPLPHVAREPGLIVTTASADVPLKGLSTLLLAYSELRRRREVRLVVVGRPRPGGALGRMLREYGLEQSVSFVSGISTEQLVELYARASVAVVPSLYEGFSLPAAEAMACAAPLVASAAGGLPEVVGVTGSAALLVPPGDPVAMLAAIEQVLDDPAEAARLGAAGRERALAHFTWERSASMTVDQYRTVLAAC